MSLTSFRDASQLEAPTIDLMESTTTDRIATSILQTCRTLDPNVKLSACTRDQENRTIVQLTASAAHTATELASALRTLMPLASVRTKQDLLSGETVARITVPTSEDEWEMAHDQARQSRVSRSLRWGSVALFCLGLGAWMALAQNADARDI